MAAHKLITCGFDSRPRRLSLEFRVYDKKTNSITVIPSGQFYAFIRANVVSGRIDSVYSCIMQRRYHHPDAAIHLKTMLKGNQDVWLLPKADAWFKVSDVEGL